MAKRDKAPHMEAIATPKGLRPHTQMDAELMASTPYGTVFELVPVSKRSNKQLRTYWKALGLVVKSTGRWPSPEHLSQDIKFTLGYRQLVTDLKTGEVHEVPDSIALASMPHEQFNAYMSAAMDLIAEKVGYDPMNFLHEGE